MSRGTNTSDPNIAPYDQLMKDSFPLSTPTCGQPGSVYRLQWTWSWCSGPWWNTPEREEPFPPPSATPLAVWAAKNNDKPQAQKVQEEPSYFDYTSPSPHNEIQTLKAALSWVKYYMYDFSCIPMNTCTHSVPVWTHTVPPHNTWLFSWMPMNTYTHSVPVWTHTVPHIIHVHATSPSIQTTAYWLQRSDPATWLGRQLWR